jgi:hypothetical protein
VASNDAGARAVVGLVIGGVAAYSVVNAFRDGECQLPIRGATTWWGRKENPGMFMLAVSLNALLGVAGLAIALSGAWDLA